MIETIPTIAPRPPLSAAKQALLEQRRRGLFQKPGVAQAIPRRPPQSPATLSFAQQRLWFLDQLEPGSPVYNTPIATRIRGPLQVKALRQSLEEIIRRHETLRTTFANVDGQPIQVIAPAVPLDWEIKALTHLDVAARESTARRLVNEDSQKPFDLRQGPLLRACLYQLAEEDFVLLVNLHHITSDAWSIGVLFQELTAIYAAYARGAASPLPEPAIQYSDFALWQQQWLQGSVFDQQLAYWKKQLQGRLPVLELPADRPRPPVLRPRGAAASHLLPESLTEALKSLSQQQGATLFMTLLAAFQVLLHRYTRLEDILVGTPIAGRNRRETEGLIGFFVNTLVLRTDLSGNPRFLELLQRVREVALDAYANQDLPFEKLVEELQPARDQSHSPLFQVMFILHNTPQESVSPPNLSLAPWPVTTNTAKFDLTLSLVEQPNGLNAWFEYNTDLFDAATIRRLGGHFQTLLEGIVANPGQSIGTLPILPDAESQQLLVDWNATHRDYPAGQCIHDLFEAQVARTPAAVALIDGLRQFTYAELNEQANRLAHYLRQQAVGPEVLVGVCLPRSWEMVVALLGILKAGGAYVPLDPAYPKDRVAFMLEDTQAPVLLTHTQLMANLPDHHAQVICLDQPIPAGESANPEPQANEHNLAYIIYTSGSTGRAKGVAIEHRSAVTLVHWAREVFSPAELGGVLASTSICFDLSVFELFVTLALGGKVILAENALQLPQLPAAEQVTLINTVPSAMMELLRLNGVPRSVRTVNLAGEPLKTSLVRQIYALNIVEKVYDLYGPSEDTTYSTCALRRPDGPATIGRPIANTQFYLLDPHRQPVPIGVAGEVYIGGDGLARGYLNRPELTAEKFVPHAFSPRPGNRLYWTGDLARYLPDGNLEFLGRIDHQVKIRGFRIELGEVEAVLSRHPTISNSVVVAREEASGDKRLVAYLAVENTAAVPAGEWRAYLRDKLPEYMIPSAFVVLAALPLTPNGKVDRQALPAPDQAPSEGQKTKGAPRDELERTLVRLWEEVLNVRPIGVGDNFFDLGGHSLLAVRLITQAEKELRHKIPLAAIFQAPTIEQLAALLRQGQCLPPESALVAIQPQGTRLPLYLVHGIGGGMFWGYANLARHLGTDQPVYALKSRGIDGRDEFERIEDMAAQYVSDLCAFQPDGPYHLGGYCFGGTVAYEMARQLRAQGKQVALLALMNCAPPNSTYGRFRWTPRSVAMFLWNIGYWIVYALRLKPQLRRAFFNWKWQMVRKRISALFTGEKTGLLEMDVGSFVDLNAYPYDIRKVWEAHVRALIKYQPQPYEGRNTLFRTRGYQYICSFDPLYGWGELARGGIDLHVVPGAHESILEEPHVAVLARQLAECLRQNPAAQSAGSTTRAGEE